MAPAGDQSDRGGGWGPRSPRLLSSSPFSKISSSPPHPSLPIILDAPESYILTRVSRVLELTARKPRPHVLHVPRGRAHTRMRSPRKGLQILIQVSGILVFPMDRLGNAFEAEERVCTRGLTCPLRDLLSSHPPTHTHTFTPATSMLYPLSPVAMLLKVHSFVLAQKVAQTC